MEINREILKNIGKRNNYQLERSYPPMQPRSLNSFFGPMVAAERSYFPLEPEFIDKNNDNENHHRFYKAHRTIDHHMDEEETPSSEHDSIDGAEQNQQQPDDLTQGDQARIQMDEQAQQEQRGQQPQQQPQQPLQQQQRQFYDDDSFSQKFNWKNY